MTENTGTPDSGDQPTTTPTSVRVPNVSATARSGLDGTVIGAAGEDADNAVAVAHSTDETTVEHPAQVTDEPDTAAAHPASLSSLDVGDTPDTADHPAQEPAGDPDQGTPGEQAKTYDGTPPELAPPTDVSSEQLYEWVTGLEGENLSEDEVGRRVAMALELEQAKPEGERDDDLIALLSTDTDTGGQAERVNSDGSVGTVQSGADEDGFGGDAPEPADDTDADGDGIRPVEGSARNGEPLDADQNGKLDVLETYPHSGGTEVEGELVESDTAGTGPSTVTDPGTGQVTEVAAGEQLPPITPLTGTATQGEPLHAGDETPTTTAVPNTEPVAPGSTITEGTLTRNGNRR